MAVLDSARSPIAASGGIGQFIAKIAGSISAWNDNRKTRSALSNLTDRELEDIGLSRAQIETIGIHH